MYNHVKSLPFISLIDTNMKKKEELKKRLISHDDLYNEVIKIFKMRLKLLSG